LQCWIKYSNLPGAYLRALQQSPKLTAEGKDAGGTSLAFSMSSAFQQMVFPYIPIYGFWMFLGIPISRTLLSPMFLPAEFPLGDGAPAYGMLQE